ncbi:urea ABC transporter ATP-binding protein UrtD [Chroococcidiopsis sp. TS-821]|nr:urea ABC transporter ATP-binding protein UrtD [Chroococcidiopsis sp. TS-821]
MLEIQDLEVSFSGFKAVSGLNLTVIQGEVRVLIGANGAGKTTTMDLISGKTKATDGRILFKGKDITNWEPHQISRIGVGRKFQIPSVFKDLTVFENMQVALCATPSVLRNLQWRIGNKHHNRIERILHHIGLNDYKYQTAKYLSHGQTQWLEIGMVLAQDPELVLLDEPTAGMTTQETRKTAEIINNLKGQHTILVVEHDMTFVRDICETITVMHQGKKLSEGTISEIENDPSVIEAYLGSGGISHA